MSGKRLSVLGFSITLFLVIAAGRKRLLVVFRPRSAHTSLISPLDSWVLPQLEFSVNLNNSNTINAQSIQPTSVPWPGFENFYAHDCVDEDVSSYVESASRCVLLHGLYQLLDEGNMNDLSHASWTHMLPMDSSLEYTLTTTVPCSPWLTNQDLASQWSDAFHSKLSITGQRKLLRHNTTFLYNKYQIFGDESQLRYLFCRELVRGIAAPLSTQGGRDPLPLPHAHRRPLSGILNRLALRSLPHTSPTFMEPEIGLLMCSLVGVRHGHAVLDPFCGTCSLLNYARYYHASRTVGVDASSTAINSTAVIANAAAIGLSPPDALFVGDAGTLVDEDGSERLGHVLGESGWDAAELFDAIVTDPPYGMQEAVVMRDQSAVRSDRGVSERSQSSLYITSLLLRICSRRLKGGGRAVFFVPSVLPPGLTPTIEDASVDVLQGYYNPSELPLPLQQLPTGSPPSRMTMHPLIRTLLL